MPPGIWQGRMEFYARAVRDTVLAFSAQCRVQHRQESIAAWRYPSHPIHQTMEEPLVLVVIAITDSHSPGMPPDLGRQKQEPQPRRRGPNAASLARLRSRLDPGHQGL